MWIFVCIPVALCVVTFVGEIAMDTIAEWRENHPSVGHLIIRDDIRKY